MKNDDENKYNEAKKEIVIIILNETMQFYYYYYWVGYDVLQWNVMWYNLKNTLFNKNTAAQNSKPNNRKTFALISKILSHNTIHMILQ